MQVLETPRLILRRFELADASFILRLVNEPSWLRFIGDKGVRSLDDARDYLRKGPLDLYQRYGFGMFMTELKAQPQDERVPIGMCGLIKRDTLPDVDIGFAFLPEYWGRGYAYEAASAVLELANRAFGLERILAIVSPGNDSSIRLLETMGMTFQHMLELAPNDPVKVFARSF
jgi:[ribosomal protein S5]-alanine N-acetyltransferase